MMAMDEISILAPKSLRGLTPFPPFAPFCKGCPLHLLVIEKEQVPIGPSQHKQEQMHKINTKIRRLDETELRPKVWTTSDKTGATTCSCDGPGRGRGADWTVVGVGEQGDWEAGRQVKPRANQSGRGRPR